MKKPNLAKGTRDFNATTLYKRRYILNTIQSYFENYGFEPLETPSFEQLETLTGKYGEEGDQLIFKILNNGLDHPSKHDKSRKALEEVLKGKSNTDLTERALRYDLTIPFARYVVMNHNDLVMPYKRYQMQPVWRADRPQKGRYREFMQCDADVIGSDSLIHEAELLSVYAKVFKALAIPEINILVNNRKVLSGLAEKIKAEDKMMDMTIAIDKLDKIGWDGVKKELTAKDFDENQVQTIQEFIAIQSEDNQEVLAQMEAFLSGTENGQKGIEELKEVMKYVGYLTSKEEMSTIKIQFSLARGLNYYTGFIVEVMTTAVKMGSIAGGGRYDDLTGLFGLKNMSGVGISFGIDRIYDVLEELDLFPPSLTQGGVQVLFLYLEEEALPIIFEQMQLLRAQGISAELYARKAKMGNQMKFADRKQIGNVVIIGSQELQANQAQIRNMKSGEQTSVSLDSIASFFKS
ncbi:MAG TPA: histidine--tRNA ligase [Chitinophagaceae bacterium]|nr:histidine--tRNA ligase [Chitinophagaceae bacterium]